MGDVTKIHRGPVASISIDTAGGSTPKDLGYLGNNNVEISFEKIGYELGDGQEVQLSGMGKIVAEIVETDSTNLADISTAAEQKIIVTGLDSKTYTIDNVLVTLSTKRGFGDEPHVATITAQKKVADEDDFVVIA